MMRSSDYDDPADAQSPAAADGEWVLERIASDGRFFLLDPETHLVYEEPGNGVLRPFGCCDPATGELLPLLRGLVSQRGETGGGAGGGGGGNAAAAAKSVSTAERPGLRDPAFTQSAAWRCALDGDLPLPGPGFRDVFAEHGWRVHSSLQAQRDLISAALALAQQRGKATAAAAAAAATAAAAAAAAPSGSDASAASLAATAADSSQHSQGSQPSPQSVPLPKLRASEDAGPSSSSAAAAGAAGGVSGGFSSVRLEPDWVADLLVSAVPSAGPADKEYVLVHLDAAGLSKAPLTLHQLLRFLGDGEDAARAAAAPALTEWTQGRSPGGNFFIAVPPEPPARLAAALEHLRAGFASLGGERGAAAAFHRIAGSAFLLGEADGAPEPRVDGRGLLAFLREAFPDLPPPDLRLLLSFLHAWGAFTPSLLARAAGVAPRRVVPRPSAELDRGLRPFDECFPPKWPPDKPDWVLHELVPSADPSAYYPSADTTGRRVLLEDRSTNKVFARNPALGGLEGEIVACGRRGPSGALELRRRRPGCFALGLHNLVHREPELIRAVFEAQYYTVTRALYWAADVVRWALVTGAREEGCGALGRDAAQRVLREVALLVDGAEPADGDHLALQWDIFLRLRAAKAAKEAAAAGGGGGAAQPPPPAAEAWRAQEVGWPEFLGALERGAVHMLEAAQFPADEDDHGVSPHEEIVDSSAMDEERWGNQLVRDLAHVEAALAEAVGMPPPSALADDRDGVRVDLSGPGGPAVAVAGEELLEFLLSPAVTRVCDGEPSRLAAVLNEWDVSRTGWVSLYDMRIALEAMTPRVVAAGGAEEGGAA